MNISNCRVRAFGLPRAFLVAALASSCAPALRSPVEPPPGALERLEQEASTGAPSQSWPASPARLEAAMRQPVEVHSVEEIPSGLSGPLRLTLSSPVLDRAIDVKWKRAPDDLDVINNSPRKEIAAYELQKLVLDPRDYVVPTTVLVCLPLDAIRGRRLEAQSIVPAGCVIGALQAWLDEVTVPEHKLETERFWGDPVYAYHAANLNLVTILMDHSDSHRENLLESTDAENRRLFSVDNGISFGSWFRNPFVRDWNRLRVPALRAETIERLRELRREDLDVLGVVAQLDCAQGDGCVRVQPGVNLYPSEGVRLAGSIIQLGLTEAEIEGIWKRRERLLRAVDGEKILVF